MAAIVTLSSVFISNNPPSDKAQFPSDKILTLSSDDDISEWVEPFSRATEDTLSGWASGPSNSASLRSYWEFVLRSLTRPFPDAALDSGKSSRFKVRSSAMERFLGRVEGRLQLKLPTDWEHAMLGGGDNREGTVTFEPKRHFSFRFTRTPIETPPGVWLSESEAEYVISVGRDSVSLTKDFVQKLTGGGTSRVSALSSAGVVIVALYSHTPGPLGVVCIDPKANTIAWSKQTLSPLSNAFEGAGYQGVNIVIAGDHAYLFGCSEDAAYILGFDIKTGSSTLRFSTGWHYSN